MCLCDELARPMYNVHIIGIYLVLRDYLVCVDQPSCCFVKVLVIEASSNISVHNLLECVVFVCMYA